MTERETIRDAAADIVARVQTVWTRARQAAADRRRGRRRRTWQDGGAWRP